MFSGIVESIISLVFSSILFWFNIVDFDAINYIFWWPGKLYPDVLVSIFLNGFYLFLLGMFLLFLPYKFHDNSTAKPTMIT